MPEFSTPADIANRALQACGAEMMDAVLGFSENSKVARQASFVYGKLRRAELRRNCWRFATKRAAIRAIDTNTMKLAPAVWVSTVTYFAGSIVSDANNTLWISRGPNNLGNQPGVDFSSWEPYFGPLSVSLYDSTVAYLAGEVVYTAAGDGTYNTYLSRLSGNALHPALPNQWISTTTYFKNTVVQQFAAYAGGTTYAAGATVTYTDGNTYTSLVSSNTGNTPTSNLGTKWILTPTLTLASQAVPSGTLLQPPSTSPVIEWAIGTTYSLGSFVMFNGTEYVAILGNNTGNLPNASGSTYWTALTGGTLYMSLIDLNADNNPSSAPAIWSASTTYTTGQQVYNTVDGLIYTSKGNGNLNNNPATDGGVNWTNTNVLCPWTTVFTQGGGNSQWTQIGGASFSSGVGLSEFNILYPIGSGPASQSTTKNAFRLPAGYLDKAPQDPKAGAVSWLGAPSGQSYNDWTYEGSHIVTDQAGPIILRFVADVQDVTQFDDMFCEGLALVMAEALCEPLNQSTAKLQALRQSRKMFEARIKNGIEVGPTQQPDDDFVTCRL